MEGSVDYYNVMRKLSEVEFEIAELTLYLDTHSNDDEAIEKYNEALAKHKFLKAEYVNLIGPLTMYDAVSSGKFSWNAEKWPWEGGIK